MFRGARQVLANRGARAATSKYGALRKTQLGRKTGEALTIIGGDSLTELK